MRIKRYIGPTLPDALLQEGGISLIEMNQFCDLHAQNILLSTLYFNAYLFSTRPLSIFSTVGWLWLNNSPLKCVQCTVPTW